MNRIPNVPHAPNIKNRSSKQLYKFTRAGIRHMNAWHRAVGIAEYVPKRASKKPAPASADSKPATAQQ